ncbi:ceramide synthase 4a isoform X2 [Brachyhypopomus gauderio]|uniref:ceramide synthase 4a isoform X2 n=1 Tax=Brachyhypopomus gauderio TaxID=698409 RepID=UPI0040416FF1
MQDLVNQWLWQQEYWLPPGVTWKDLNEGSVEGGRHPLPRDLIITVPLALGFIALRFAFERVVALPLSRKMGVSDRVRLRAPAIPKLEAFYMQKKKHVSQGELLGLEKHCGLTPRQIHNWLRLRRNQDRPSNTKKFCEASWRFAFYLIAFAAGFASLIDTPWFWDHRECWRGYPRQDFKEQIVHHIATIVLMGFSYSANYVRIGTLVILVHDSSDFLLESAKMFNYAGWRKTCDSLFVVFSVVFLVTRLVIFPCRVVHTTLVVALDFMPLFPGYYFFNALLLILQALHVFWAYLILRMLYKFIFLGKVERDERSDEESEEEGDEEEEDEEDATEECCWEKRKGTLNSRLVSLANNCVLNNLTNQRKNLNSRLPKAR